MLRINVYEYMGYGAERKRIGRGSFLSAGPVHVSADLGFSGSDATPPDPPQLMIEAPPHRIMLWSLDRETFEILWEPDQ